MLSLIDYKNIFVLYLGKKYFV